MLRRRTVLTGLLAAPLVVRDYSVLMPARLSRPTVWYVLGNATGSGVSWSDPANIDFVMRRAGRGDHVLLGKTGIRAFCLRRPA